MTEAKQGWQPIETAPTEDGSVVLLYGRLTGEINGLFDGMHVGVGERFCGRFTCPHVDAYSVDWEATHWMSIPLPPAKDPA
jgi:hypothetical protein